MEEDTAPVNSNNQLYHMLKTDTFTFCLICLEVISSTQCDIRKHLNGTNHAESIKCLFKACNPSLIDDIEDERFVEVVLKSVFDISVLLGKETCYISKKENYWFCLMCEQNVSERNLVDGVVKDNIIDHLLSNHHVQKVKGVCFLYILNGNQDFLLLNKSVVYCSVCKDVMPCKDVDLLKTTAVHLEMKHPKYAISSGLQYEMISMVKQEELMMIEGCLSNEEVRSRANHPNTKSVPKTKCSGEVKVKYIDDPYVNDQGDVDVKKSLSKYSRLSNQTGVEKSFFNDEQFWKDKNIGVCLLCKKIISLSKKKGVVFVIDKHFSKFHKKLYTEKSLKYIINRVVFHNDPVHKQYISKFEPIDRNLRILIGRSCVQKYSKYVLKAKNLYFCIYCMVSMPSCVDDNDLIKHLSNHFNSYEHKQCEEKKKKLDKALKVDQTNKALLRRLRSRKETIIKQLQKRKDKKKKRNNRRKVYHSKCDNSDKFTNQEKLKRKIKQNHKLK